MPPRAGVELTDNSGDAAFRAWKTRGSDLEVQFRFDELNTKGEVWLPLRQYTNLQDADIEAEFSIEYAPKAATGERSQALERADTDGVGAQVIVRTVNEHLMEPKQYLSWTELSGPAGDAVHLHASPTMIAKAFPENSYTDPGLDTFRSAGVGLKLDFEKRLADRSPIEGVIRIRRLRVRTADLETQRGALEALSSQESDRLRVARQEWAQEVSAAPPPPSAGFLPVAFGVPQIKGRNVARADLISIGKHGGLQVHLRFDKAAALNEGQAARLRLNLTHPVRVMGNTIRSYCAAAPGLQGALARPNRMRWTLFDKGGHMIEGPAISISTGVFGAEYSPWFPVEISPTTAAPMAMGFSEPEFDGIAQALELDFYVSRGAQEFSRTPAGMEGEVRCTVPAIGSSRYADPAPSVSSSALVTGVQPKFFADIDALAEVAARRGDVGLVPVLFDFYAWNGIKRQYFRTWSYNRSGRVERFTHSWDEGEHVEWILSEQHQNALMEHAIRPIVRRFLDLNTKYPGLIRAIDLGNEPGNAEAVINERDFPRVLSFFRKLLAVTIQEIAAARSRGMSEDVETTIGLRRAEDYVRFWKPAMDGWDERPSVLQVHYYDDFAERNGITLLHRSGQTSPRDARRNTEAFLAQENDIYVGEAEGHSPREYLDLSLKRGFKGVSFWQLRSVTHNDDAFAVDLDSFNKWRRATAQRRAASKSTRWDGLNLPWLKYGRDFGVDPYEPSRCGYSTSSSKAWLGNLLDQVPRIARDGSRTGRRDLLLRVFVGTDWRSGLIYDTSAPKTAAEIVGSYRSPFLAFERFKEAVRAGDFAGACRAFSQDLVDDFVYGSLRNARLEHTQGLLTDQQIAAVRETLDQYTVGDALSGEFWDTASTRIELPTPCEFLRDLTLATGARPAIAFLSGADELRNLRIDGDQAVADLSNDGVLLRRVAFVKNGGEWRIAGVTLAVDEAKLENTSPPTPYQGKVLPGAVRTFSVGTSGFGWELANVEALSTDYTGWIGIRGAFGFLTANDKPPFAGAPKGNYFFSGAANLAWSFHRWNGGGLGVVTGGEMLFAHSWSRSWGAVLLGPIAGLQVDVSARGLLLVKGGLVYWIDPKTGQGFPGSFLGSVLSY